MVKYLIVQEGKEDNQLLSKDILSACLQLCISSIFVDTSFVHNIVHKHLSLATNYFHRLMSNTDNTFFAQTKPYPGTTLKCVYSANALTSLWLSDSSGHTVNTPWHSPRCQILGFFNPTHEFEQKKRLPKISLIVSTLGIKSCHHKLTNHSVKKRCWFIPGTAIQQE